LENSSIHNLVKPDLLWDGKTIPLADNSIDCAIATEVFEHCFEVEPVMREIWRVLKPGGSLFFTVPFLWPLHEVPYDAVRYTPFSLNRYLEKVGFSKIDLRALGGWDASFAQMIGLWSRRRLMSKRKRKFISMLALPIIRYLLKKDRATTVLFKESSMITGIKGVAYK
jgi:SAM-dependent methyltransferase